MVRYRRTGADQTRARTHTGASAIKLGRSGLVPGTLSHFSDPLGGVAVPTQPKLPSYKRCYRGARFHNDGIWVCAGIATRFEDRKSETEQWRVSWGRGVARQLGSWGGRPVALRAPRTTASTARCSHHIQPEYQIEHTTSFAARVDVAGELHRPLVMWQRRFVVERICREGEPGW
jgi:hypothetical protein